MASDDRAGLVCGVCGDVGAARPVGSQAVEGRVRGPALWLKHRPLARRLARDWSIPGAEREDVEQEALIALWEASRAWRPDGGASFRTFAETVIRRRLADAVKAAARGKHRPLTCSTRVDAEGAPLDLPCLHQVADVAEDRERLRAVVAAINRDLTPLERHCVIGIANGRPYRELGDVKAVDNALGRARRKLRAAA